MATAALTVCTQALGEDVSDARLRKGLTDFATAGPGVRYSLPITTTRIDQWAPAARSRGHITHRTIHEARVTAILKLRYLAKTRTEDILIRNTLVT